MIIEQAFIALPELLLGNHYSVQDYEAGIVGVLSMAILQELNGRNANSPIQHLQSENDIIRRWRVSADLYVEPCAGLMISEQKARLRVTAGDTTIGSKQNSTGKKSSVQRHATNKSLYQGQMIADVIRLTCLVPLTLGNRDSNGRYFLHRLRRRTQVSTSRMRTAFWVQLLHEAGRQDIVIDQLSAESATAKNQFGVGLQNLQVQATVTNLCEFSGRYGGRRCRHYWCRCLTLIRCVLSDSLDHFFISDSHESSHVGKCDPEPMPEL